MRLVQHWYAPSVAFHQLLSETGCQAALSVSFLRQLLVVSLLSVLSLTALGADCQAVLPGCTARVLSTGALHQLLLEAKCQAAVSVNSERLDRQLSGKPLQRRDSSW